MNQAATHLSQYLDADNQTIEAFDTELWSAMSAETVRQEEHIELIASENYCSPRVLEAQGSVLTNKYAEGYPGKRYYGGCEFVDQAETLAIERAKALFGADFANVQPHSGSSANIAVFQALLKPGDTVLGMSLADGGHLTHGASVNFSGKIYNPVQYGIDNATGLIDYDAVRDLAVTHKPKLIIGGFRLTAGSSIGPNSARLPTKWGLIFWWIWPTLQVWWRLASIPAPSLTPML